MPAVSWCSCGFSLYVADNLYLPLRHFSNPHHLRVRSNPPLTRERERDVSQLHSFSLVFPGVTPHVLGAGLPTGWMALGLVPLSVLSVLEENDPHLSYVKVDVVVLLMSDKATEISPYKAIPCGSVLPVELFFNKGGNLLLVVRLHQTLLSAKNSEVLHILRHLADFDHSATQLRYFLLSQGKSKVLWQNMLQKKKEARVIEINSFPTIFFLSLSMRNSNTSYAVFKKYVSLIISHGCSVRQSSATNELFFRYVPKKKGGQKSKFVWPLRGSTPIEAESALNDNETDISYCYLGNVSMLYELSIASNSSR
eukprot:gene4706-3399_t